MTRTSDITILKNEYAKTSNDWKDVYQWKRIASKGNTEIISEMLLKDFDNINWSDSGLRTEHFKIKNHEGKCDYQTAITQFTEKRFCRALFNEKNIPFLGKIIDYEVPLTKPKQGAGKINQGDIDLISIKDNYLYLMEAKKANSTESLLKAILEIFVYIFRMYKFRTINTFKEEYGSHFKEVVPVVLIFKNSTSGQQILEFNKYPHLKNLLKRINKEFSLFRIHEIQFFSVDSYSDKWDTALKIKNEKIHLDRHITFTQYFIEKDCCEFENIINSKSNTQDIESHLNSYFTYCKDAATKYVINHISHLMDEIAKYKAIYPKNEKMNVDFDLWARSKAYPFIEAYCNIAKKHSCFSLLDLNLKLMRPYINSMMVPIVSCYKEEKVLVKLIEAYNEIPIKQSHDYDGVSSHQIDLDQEAIIVSAICDFDDKRIIPILQNSLLTGKYRKEKVVDTLLKYITKDEIVNSVKHYGESNNLFFNALTDYPRNAQWVIEYLNKN